MCGIFGIISASPLEPGDLKTLAHHAEQRGRDSSGLVIAKADGYDVQRADFAIHRLLREVRPRKTRMVMGHSRLITNGLSDNQPVVRDGVIVLHNGIIVNDEVVWGKLRKARQLQVDTEVIAAIAAEHLEAGGEVEGIAAAVRGQCRGVVACAIAVPRLGKLVLFSNNGSLYIGYKGAVLNFASEAYALGEIGCTDVRQVYNPVVADIPVSESISIKDRAGRSQNLIPALTFNSAEEAILVHPRPELRRCTRCVLPETMPFIKFDDEGVCNYCHNYKKRNKPKPREELFSLVEPYRRKEGSDCIVPFSGGRDSCYALHLIVNELKMKPVTYTYDWGMVTDLGRRNISRMSAELGVREHHRGRRHFEETREHRQESARLAEGPASRHDQHSDGRRQALLPTCRNHEAADGDRPQPVGLEPAGGHSLQGRVPGRAAGFRGRARLYQQRVEADALPAPASQGHDAELRLLQQLAVGYDVG